MTSIYQPTVYATPEEAMRAAYNNETAAGYNQWKNNRAGRQWTYDQFNGRGVTTAEIQRQMRAYYDSTLAPQWDEYNYDATQQAGGGYVGARLPPGQRRQPPPPPPVAPPPTQSRPRPGQPGYTGFHNVRPPSWRPLPPIQSFAGPHTQPIGPPRPRPMPAGTPGMGVNPSSGGRVVSGGQASVRIPQAGRAYSRY